MNLKFYQNCETYGKYFLYDSIEKVFNFRYFLKIKKNKYKKIQIQMMGKVDMDVE